MVEWEETTSVLNFPCSIRCDRYCFPLEEDFSGGPSGSGCDLALYCIVGAGVLVVSTFNILTAAAESSPLVSSKWATVSGK